MTWQWVILVLGVLWPLCLYSAWGQWVDLLERDRRDRDRVREAKRRGP